MFFYTLFDILNTYIGLMDNGLFDGFINANYLWESMQSTMVAFVDNHGGNADYYIPSNIKIRPDYDKIKQYLKKQINWYQFEQEIGCL